MSAVIRAVIRALMRALRDEICHFEMLRCDAAMRRATLPPGITASALVAAAHLQIRLAWRSHKLHRLYAVTDSSRLEVS